MHSAGQPSLAAHDQVKIEATIEGGVIEASHNCLDSHLACLLPHMPGASMHMQRCGGRAILSTVTVTVTHRSQQAVRYATLMMKL